jgi:2-polyprenyl-3-methyl-5-hydroxy-6-metoxy-1,4-benzoquinol methylase
VSEPMLEVAKRPDRHAGAAVAYLVAEAEDTGLPGGSFDAVTAGAAVGAGMNPQAIVRFDAELLRDRFAEEPLMVRHRVFAVLCSAPK